MIRNLSVFVILNIFFSFNSYAVFSEHQNGIIDRIELKSEQKILYLTIDLCGSKTGLYPDKKLFEFLIENNIKTTLFVSCKFLSNENNKEFLKKIHMTNLFSIQNHGTSHIPLSINGKIIYGIRGTKSRDEIKNEVFDCADEIYKIIGNKPNWYRSGTAYYDTEAIKILAKNKINIAGFAITLDEGATLKELQIIEKSRNINSGDILLLHGNHPESDTRIALAKIIKDLLEIGYTFDFLPDCL